MKRTVLYARVSGDDRDKESRNLKGQLDMCREYAQQHDWLVIAELAEDDRGAPGGKIDLPQLTKALEMARAGEVDVLVVRELDRFARGLAKQLIVESEFKRAGVDVEYVLGEYPNTPEGNLNKNIKAVIAEYERLKINERVTRGRRLKVKAGNVIVNGLPPYGYKVKEKDDKRTLEIHETEARIIRQIFTWYTQGDGENGPLSLYGIARKLTEMKVPTSVDTGRRRKSARKEKGYGEWIRPTVSYMLKNETYAGVWHYGKYDRQQKANPDDYLLAVEVPAIVSREVWQEAQDRLAHNRKHRRGMAKYKYLLSGRVTCGMCWKRMVGLTTTWGETGRASYYRCNAPSNRDYATRCELKTCFRADEVDDAVWQWVVSFLTDPEELRKGWEDFQAEKDQQNRPLCERLAVVESLIADNRQQLEKLIDLYLSGDFPKEMLTERKKRLETTLEALENERAGLAAKLRAQTLTEQQIKNLQAFAHKIGKGADRADFRIKRGVFEALDVQATLAVEDGEKVVHTRCIMPYFDNSITLRAPLSNKVAKRSLTEINLDSPLS